MSSEWGTVSTIGVLIENNGGSIKTGPFGTVLKASEYVAIGVPLISVREIGHGSFNVDSKTPRVSPQTTSRLSEYLLKSGDIVFARKGGIDRCALVKEEQAGWFLGSDGIRLRPPSVCDARFLAYSLQTQSAKEWLTQHSTGSTMASLNQATIARLPICLPSIREQKKIADCLKAFDDRIVLLRETNTTLEAIAQALFKSWFVDFDPVRAKQEGREPEGMDADTAALFPDSFEESELGLVPKGWIVRKADTLLTRLSTKVRYTKEQVSSFGVTPVYEQGAKILFGYHNDKAQFSATPTEPIFIFGDHTCVTHLSCEPFDISMNVIALKGSDRPTIWTYYAIKDKQTFQEYRRHWMELAVKDVVVAPVDVCDQFALVASSLHVRMESNTWQANTLAALRNTLLPRLISGQLRLPEAEAILKEAAA